MILMQKNLSNINLDRKLLDQITYLTGSADVIEAMTDVPARVPFSTDICDFLQDISKVLMADKRSREYPDIATFAFWIRNTSVIKLRERFVKEDGTVRLGRGIAFHVAPSNVPVNFAYSLVSGLLMGNSNIVRVPTKDFPQVEIIIDAFNEVLRKWKSFIPYIALVRYERNQKINDILSVIADIRIVWGGDATIAELRKSPLPPRSIEITFADRYSLAVIDSDVYMGIGDKGYIAESFYNDTFLTDQNACTSPRIVIWMGKNREAAKKEFWENLHSIAKDKYIFHGIQSVNKLTSAYLTAVAVNGTKIVRHEDNLIVRVHVPEISSGLMEWKDNSGYFFEYDCENVEELKPLVNDKRCQTVGVIGSKEWLKPLIQFGIKGIDRVVDVGHTMDFDLIWDGYDLVNQMSRVVNFTTHR